MYPQFYRLESHAPPAIVDPTLELVCTPLSRHQWPDDEYLIDPIWRTETVLGLAATIRETHDYTILPILADALQDAGCESESVLEHCRFCKTHHHACWVVSAVLMRPRLPKRVPDMLAQKLVYTTPTPDGVVLHIPEDFITDYGSAVGWPYFAADHVETDEKQSEELTVPSVPSMNSTTVPSLVHVAPQARQLLLVIFLFVMHWSLRGFLWLVLYTIYFLVMMRLLHAIFPLNV